MEIELNEEQEKAMLATEGAVLVTAGAGSGKTRLLTQRIAYLIKEKGVDGFNILAITFTNKASREMKSRLNSIVGEKNLLWISTIHSMCATILRRDIEKLNPKFDAHFTIYSTEDSVKMLKKALVDVLKQGDEQDDKSDDYVRQILYHMSIIKNNNITYRLYAHQNQHIKNIDEICEIIEKYQLLLEEANALDFDDLLVFTENLLKKDENVRNYYQRRFKYILVDEFQDTNVVQYNIIKLLAGENQNVFVVGDEDQCIYSWRGANIKNIKDFMRDFKDCQVFKLEQNYRSTQQILDISNKLISYNSERIPKVLRANKDNSGVISYRTFGDDKAEAEFVAQTIYALHKNSGIEYKDIAVLMRINALSRNVEEKLLSYNIPHIVYGGLKFFDRLEVKNAVSYLRLIANPSDVASFIRIINYPKRGIGDTTVNKLLEGSHYYNLPIFEMCGSVDLLENITSATRDKIKDFYAMLKEVGSKIEEVGISETLDTIIKVFGIKDLYKDRSEENKNRMMNLYSLIGSAKEFEKDNENMTLVDYLESITLISDADTDDSDNCVSIASVHAVKGLEFKVVFVIGAENRVFPTERDDTNLEEERRLMYVAITRAEEYLYITNAERRFLYGHYDSMRPSDFLKEMGFDVDKSSYSSANKTSEQFYSNGYGDYNYYNKRTQNSNFVSGKLPFGKSVDSLIKKKTTESCETSKTGFDIGKSIDHKYYGVGQIVGVSGEGASKMITVQFEKVGKKVLMLEYAPVKLID